jgi:phage terminase large subunit
VQDHIKYEQYRFINEYFYNVYCRGHWGVLGEIVFRKFYMSRMTDDYIKRLPQKGIRFGLDFGWNDPFTIVKCHIDHNTRVIHILDEFYRSKVETDQMIGITRSFVGMSQVICDSADPRNIDTLQTHGVMAIGAYKPSGHKERAWIWLQSYMMYIDIDRCPNFAREISTYQWQKDNNGRVIQKLQDGNDHALDAFIYSINIEIMNSSEGKSYG